MPRNFQQWSAQATRWLILRESHVGTHVVVLPFFRKDSGLWEWSPKETRPTRRSLNGEWWNDNWEAIKAIRARKSDGEEKAAWFAWGPSEVIGYKLGSHGT